MGPYKCPDCGVWWAGLEHRCRVPIPGTGTWIEPIFLWLALVGLWLEDERNYP